MSSQKVGKRKSNDLDGGTNGGGVVGLVPLPINEPSVVCELSGYFGGTVNVCGWSRKEAEGFDFRDTLKVNEMCDDKGKIKETVKEHLEVLFTLEDMAELVGKKQVFHPVHLHVIAKKKVDLFVHDNKVLILSTLVVADETGYSTLCSFNQAVQTLYNHVEMGDKLLLTFALPQTPKRIQHKGLFSNEMFFELELKVQFHSVGAHYKRTFDPRRSSLFKFPEKLLKQDHLLLPSEINFQKPPQTGEYCDLVGVVSYVSRVERSRISRNDQTSCLIDGERKVLHFQQYNVFRWISLVDETSQPLLVKLTNTPNKKNQELIPGAIVVLTHCQFQSGQGLEDVLEDSSFSTIFAGLEVEKYFRLHPTEIKLKMTKIMARDSYVKILGRTDIAFTLGGSIGSQIAKPDIFRQCFKISHGVPLLSRRESVLWKFSGKIYKVFRMENDDFPVVHYTNKRYQEVLQRRKVFTYIEHYPTFEYKVGQSWYSFIRQLPSPCHSSLELPRTREIMTSLLNVYEPYCGPLLFPATMPSSERLPLLAELKRVDGPPYFVIDIVDESNATWQRCIWKPSGKHTLDEMAKKIESAKEKNVLCMGKIFRVEEKVPFEFVLHDFMVVD